MRRLVYSRILAARLFATGLLLAGAGDAPAEVHYADVNSTNPTPPYTNWATAATNIQDAVDAAVAGDDVVLTNGTYGPVRVSTALNLRSVNGPQFTRIDGAVGGGYRFRCAYLASGASLTGFTLTNGDDKYSSPTFGGGGVFCESVTTVVSNCVITGNISTGFHETNGMGGGAYGGTLNNCILSNNTATAHDAYAVSPLSSYGGGACGCTLNNSTLLSNSVVTYQVRPLGTLVAYGGGTYGCTLSNCTLAGNRAFAMDFSGGGFLELAGGAGSYGGTLNNCIVPSNLGDFCYNCTLVGCWTADPLFMDYASGNLRLQPNSPCINAGNNAYAPTGHDLDGNPRIAGGTVDIGAYEYQAPVSRISYAWLQQYGLPINGTTDTADPDGDGVDSYHEWLAFTDPTNRLSSPAQLTITPSGTNVILTWAPNAFPPSVIGGQNTITNPTTSSQQFYRLVH
jgi:hypothetical protein